MSVAVNGAVAPPVRSVEQLIGTELVGTGTSVEVPPRGNEGERRPGWLVLEDERVAPGDRRCAVIGLAGEVHATGRLSAVTAYLRIDGEVMPDWAGGVAIAAWGAQRAQEALAAERALWSDRLETAHQWAIDRNHCGEYDELMDVLGLPGRERDFTMDLTISMDVRVRALAATSYAATSELTHHAIASAISVMTLSELTAAINDHTVEDVEAS